MSEKTRFLDPASLPLAPTDIVHVVQPGGDRQATVEDFGGGSAPTIPQSFYEPTDPDFFDAIDRALAYLKTTATTGYGYGNIGSARLLIPRGSVYLMGNRTLDVTHGVIIEGESTGLLGPGASVLQWDAGTTGIRLQEYNTTGATGVLGVPATSSGRAIIRNLLLQGTYSGAESEAHAIHTRTLLTLEDVSIYNFAGDGVHIVATAGAGAPVEGNANSFYLRRVFAQGCRNGFYTDGADVNAGKMDACVAIANRRWGFWDSSFLGNTYDACQAADNGLVAGAIPNVVSVAGNRYCVKKDQGAGASTNAPSGTTADNAYWYYMGAGGVSAPNNINAWVSGTTYRDGGSYRSDGEGNAGNVFSGCYIEGSQGFAQIDAPALVSGGEMRPNVKGVACLYGDSGGTGLLGYVGSSGGFFGFGNLTVLGANHIFGADSGPVSDLQLLFYNTNFATSFSFYQSNVLNSSLLAFNGGLYLDGTAGVHLRYGAADQFATTATGSGYMPGVGGTVTQATSKSTAVTLNKICGQITLNAASLAAGASASFTLNNSMIQATDEVGLWIVSGASPDAYNLTVTAVAGGSCRIQVRNFSAGALAEGLVIGFTVRKAQNS
jgi:hypothetical protein